MLRSKLTAALIAALMLATVAVLPASASDRFPDVGDSHPFHDEIGWLALNEITTGYSDGTFRPTANVTRQAIAAYFYRYAGEPVFSPPSTATFSDVPTTHPFFTAIEWLNSTGITTGYSDGTFRPTANVTRQAIAAYLYRYNRAIDLGVTTRISVATDGTQGNDYSGVPTVSADGRYIVYASNASNLVTGDSNSAEDVFVWDSQSSTTTRISVATDGTQADDNSALPSVSADGRYIAYMSRASNLVTGDSNSAEDIFVWDSQSSTTTLISVATDGTQANGESRFPAISADGRYITYLSIATTLVTGDSNAAWDLFVWDSQSSTTTRISVATDGTQANDNSVNPKISSDGRYITYYSEATNLVTGDSNGISDVFVWDSQGSTTTRISVATDGTQSNGTSVAPAISADGRYIAYYSTATNLVTGDSNGAWDLFVRDLQSSTTTLTSVATDGTQGSSASIDSDFLSAPAISGDGRYVTFISIATNLAAGDSNGISDVFVRDRQSSTTTRVSVASDGTQGERRPAFPAMSGDGRYIAYMSEALNLVPNDTNSVYDVFVWDRGP